MYVVGIFTSETLLAKGVDCGKQFFDNICCTWLSCCLFFLLKFGFHSRQSNLGKGQIRGTFIVNINIINNKDVSRQSAMLVQI